MYSLALIIFVVSEKKAFEYFPKGPMLIYVLRWQPSWISDRHKKQRVCRGSSNDHSWAVLKYKEQCKRKCISSSNLPLQNICRIIQKLKSLVCNISHKIYANLCYKILLVTYDNVGVSTLDFLLSSTNKTYLFDITEILLKIV